MPIVSTLRLIATPNWPHNSFRSGPSAHRRCRGFRMRTRRQHSCAPHPSRHVASRPRRKRRPQSGIAGCDERREPGRCGLADCVPARLRPRPERRGHRGPSSKPSYRRFPATRDGRSERTASPALAGVRTALEAELASLAAGRPPRQRSAPAETGSTKRTSAWR
jgi:hypothetical protein